MNRLLFDYCAFSIRLDSKSPVRFDGALNLDYICRLLGIPAGEFSNCGKVKYYKERYECNNISVSVPYDRNEIQQGYLVSMSGMGCRYFEANQIQGEMISAMDVWRNFLSKIRSLTALGLAINISRLDVAIDDYSGLLDIDEIAKSVRMDEVASRFQSRDIQQGKKDIFHAAESIVIERFYRRICGTSVNFGSRNSRSYCRFYDKKAEQMQRFYGDKKKMQELSAIPHWVRMEFEFKDENAIKMVNSFCDETDFPAFFAQYVNGMIRFVERDDTNIGRCTTKKWWLDFIGTSERTHLTVGDYKPVSREKHLDYVYNKLSGAIYAAMNISGVDTFFNTVLSIANGKLKEKHRKLCEGLEFNLKELCSAELWDALKPSPISIPRKLHDYWYTEKDEKPFVFQSIGKYGGVQLGLGG